MLLDLSATERLLILRALNNELTERDQSETARLATKIGCGAASPDIIVGVHGGQVQWVLGNPFPVRVCDYDGEIEDLPDVDERGQRCRMWLEPADNAAV